MKSLEPVAAAIERSLFALGEDPIPLGEESEVLNVEDDAATAAADDEDEEI